jgi:hypothetical protein
LVAGGGVAADEGERAGFWEGDGVWWSGGGGCGFVDSVIWVVLVAVVGST